MDMQRTPLSGTRQGGVADRNASCCCVRRRIILSRVFGYDSSAEMMDTAAEEAATVNHSAILGGSGRAFTKRRDQFRDGLRASMRRSSYGSDAEKAATRASVAVVSSEEADYELSPQPGSMCEATAPTTAALPSETVQVYNIQVVVEQDRPEALTAAVVIQRFARGHYGRVRLRKQTATAAKISRTLERARAAKKKSRTQRSSTSSMLQPVDGRIDSSPTPKESTAKRGRVTVVRRRSTRSRITMEEDPPAAIPAVDTTASSTTLEDDDTRIAPPPPTLSQVDRTNHLMRSFLDEARQAKQKQEAPQCQTTNAASAEQSGEKRPTLARRSSSSFGVGF
jgi:hypothetical protein